MSGATKWLWRCCCGAVWSEPAHMNAMRALTGGTIWRGNPGLLTPHRQWCRENLPSGRDGCTIAGDDGFLRSYTAADPEGLVAPMEWKAFGRRMDHATHRTLEALRHRRLCEPIVITLYDGNTPGALRHYPQPCVDELPEQPIIARTICVNGWEIESASELRDALLRLVQEPIT